jgi:aspartate aminotransferase
MNAPQAPVVNVPLSKRVKSLKPSPTLALSAKAKEMAAQGHDVISLSVGEPDWDTLTVAKEAGIVAIQEGFSKYTAGNGIPELRKAIASITTKELGVPFSPDDVTVSSGGKFVIFEIFQCLLDDGDEVIIPAPYWVSYPPMAELAGGKPVIVSGLPNSKLTADRLASAITAKTKVLVLNSPSNPTGLMYSRSELLALAEVLRLNPHVFILSDDIYNRLVFEGDLAPHILHVAPDLKDRTIVMNGASKTYSMTGWRVGWALATPVLIKAMNNFGSQSVSQACSISQRATLAALLHGEPELRSALKMLRGRRDSVVAAFQAVPFVKASLPDGAFYVWLDIREFCQKANMNSADFSARLLAEHKVAVVPGVEFGEEGFVRLSYAIDEKRALEAVDRINSFVTNLVK